MGVKTYSKGVVVKLSTNFNSTEFDCHGNSCCSQTLVDEQLVICLQMIRDHFNAPISVTSGFRCIRHNSNIGSGTGSQHVKGCAADIVVSGVAPREVAKYAESIGIKGIGLYETGSDGHFVHIDTRTVKAFWYGQAQKKMTTFGGTSAGTTTTVTPSTTVNNTAGSTTIVLTRGSSGDAVRELQANLIRLGYSCGNSGADGIFGSATVAAVRLFQNEYGGMGVDGIAGYQTLAGLKDAVASNMFRVKVTATALNVRSGIGTNYPVKTIIKKNATYLVCETKNNWGKLRNPDGWISLQYASKI